MLEDIDESVRRFPAGDGEIVVRTRRVVLSGEKGRLEAERLRESLETAGEEALRSAVDLQENLARGAGARGRGGLLLGIVLAMGVALLGLATAGGGGFLVGLLVGFCVLAATSAKGAVRIDPVQVKLSVVTHRMRDARSSTAVRDVERRAV